MPVTTKKKTTPENISELFPGFQGAWCLVDYIPKSPDKTFLALIVSCNNKPLDQLCHSIAAHHSASYFPKLLTKSKTTRPLHKLNKTERRKELNNIYRIDPSIKPYRHKNILIVDDIVTTGTTMNAIKQAISKICPSAKFYFFTLAKTINKYAGQEIPKY